MHRNPANEINRASTHRDMAQNDASRDLFVGDWDLRIAGADQDTKYYVYTLSFSPPQAPKMFVLF